MASLDKAQQQEGQRRGKSYPQEDAEIATRMGIKMLSEGNGIQVIKDAIDQSQDPAQVIGQFLGQMMGQLAEQLAKEANIDPGVFLAKNGFLDAILNYIEGKLGYPPEFSDQIYDQVLEVIKAAAMSGGAQGQGMQQQGGQPGPEQAPPQQAAPPQQGVM